MSALFGTTDPIAKRRPPPVTDPVRVAIVDPAPADGAALAHEVDLDRELAVVACCTNLRRAASDIRRSSADLVAIRLAFDDPDCVTLLTSLAAGEGAPCVVVLGAIDGDGGPDLAGRLKARIREVAEASFGLTPAPKPAGRRLN